LTGSTHSTSSGQAHVYVPGLKAASDVKVQVFTVAFRAVYERDFQRVQPGTPLTIPSTDQWNKQLANGLYYVIATTPQGRTLGKWLILR
jgi:hypothetical protein